MKLVEKHIVKKSSYLFKEIDHLSFLSKNLYNAALYHIRQHYFSTKKYVNYFDVQKHFQNSKNPDYYAFPARISQQILIQVDRDFTNFFAALREYKINPNKFKGRPRLPHYKDKIKGRNNLVYLYRAVSFKNNQLKLSKTNIKIKSKCDRKDICQVSINKIMGGYCINVCYEKKRNKLKIKKKECSGDRFRIM
jgi:putative transposase